MSASKKCSASLMAVEIEPSGASSPDFICLMASLDAYLNRVCGVERNHGSPIERLAQDDTQMFIARIDGQAVGCAGLQVFDDGTGEVKRMYVVDDVRGKGVGSKLLTRVIDTALAVKVSVLRLETTEFLPEAQKLYRAKGFVPCEAYGSYLTNPINLYFEKFLLPTALDKREK